MLVTLVLVKEVLVISALQRYVRAEAPSSKRTERSSVALRSMLLRYRSSNGAGLCGPESFAALSRGGAWRVHRTQPYQRQCA